MNLVKAKFRNDLRIPRNFVKTVPGHSGGVVSHKVKQPQAHLNPQTKCFCEKLGVDDPLALVLNNTGDSAASFSEESGLEDSQNTTTVDDTDATDKSIESVNASLRTRLSLPEPASEDYDSSVCVLSLAESKQEGDEMESRAAEVVENGEFSNSPRPKKFIRRNADIYNEDSAA